MAKSWAFDLMESFYVPIGGGIDGTSPRTQMPLNKLRLALNVEAKPGGGIRSILGYSKFDSNEISGEGPIRGVHYYNGKVYAFRHAAGGLSTVMWESAGSGWTSKKTGLSPNGTYRCINHAFSGTAEKMYIASGVDKAAEWDGSTWTDLTTGMSPDTPTHIAAFKKHLFLSFGHSVQNSSLGAPGTWSALTGSTEILMPRAVTGLVPMPNGTLGIFTDSGINFLSGSVAADFVITNTVEFSNNAGAIADTIEPMGSRVLFCDSRGITDLSASDVSSDFYNAIVSHDLDEYINYDWTGAVCSTVVRAKGQYRLFFDDNTGVILTIVGNTIMPTVFQFPIPVNCVVNTEDSNGNELIYFGSDDGYVRQMESGTSFDGTAIGTIVETAPTHLGVPFKTKRFRRVRFDLNSSGVAAFTAKPEIYIDDGSVPEQSLAAPVLDGQGTLLGSGLLGSLLLGGSPIIEGELDLDGHGKWIAFRIVSSSTTASKWDLDGYTIEYLPGRTRR